MIAWNAWTCNLLYHLDTKLLCRLGLWFSLDKYCVGVLDTEGGDDDIDECDDKYQDDGDVIDDVCHPLRRWALIDV